MLPLFDGLKSFSHFSSRTVYSRRRCLRDQTRTSLNVMRRLAFVEWWRIFLVKYPQWTAFFPTKVHKRWSKTKLDVRSRSNRSLKSGNLLARGRVRTTREQLGRVHERIVSASQHLFSDSWKRLHPSSDESGIISCECGKKANPQSKVRTLNPEWLFWCKYTFRIRRFQSRTIPDSSRAVNDSCSLKYIAERKS